MLMMRILGPVITFVNKPWKSSDAKYFFAHASERLQMYPVGVLFGFGFDTASSIALLAISALGRKRSDGSSIPSSHIVILPLLFTAGMTILDSADSVLMLYSYSGFPERTWAIIHKQTALHVADDTAHLRTDAEADADADAPAPAEVARDQRVKANVMSGLSIILTLMSIFVAFSISLITIMALIREQCAPCQEAAEAPDGGGLVGRWWRGWATANDNSGYIGAGIVGSFVVVVAGWYAGRRMLSARQVRLE